MVVVLSILALAALVGLLYLLCYGGYQGPVDWIMRTDSHGDRGRRRVALTFDDGPHPVHTAPLLDALAELGVPATFFVVGRDVDANPELVARIARDGHELGNHTYRHRYLPLARSRSVERELDATDRAIARAAGVVPRIARPPWGGRSPRNVAVFRRLRKRLVLWDVNSYDWKGKPAAEVVRRVLARARGGSIILMHEARDGGETTIEAVRMLVPALRARGFELVTVSRAIA
ncbi:MAG: polysaccharide deacetylase family protein [Deltaproteobacteria bacterium]|nr:MAG: polysaccharide deacetylase family protein [Deltaproteobacteria bacterium]TMQ13848.1 MAG: polysaccharide deacetylase family protein [Deltaproteobacteria bacterium]